VLKEQVGRTFEGVDHAPNVLQIVGRNSTWVEECRFVAPDDVTQCEPHVGQCDVANLVDFWWVSENVRQKAVMVMLRRTLRHRSRMWMGPFCRVFKCAVGVV
jgi:hypothetical protein